MGLSLVPTMANVFLSFYELKWLEQCPKEFEPVFYRRCVDDIFVFFESAEHLSDFLVIQTSPFALKKDKMER